MSESKLAHSPLETLDDPVGRSAADRAAADWLAAIAPLGDRIVGTNGNDVLSAGGEGDVVLGLKGDDVLSSAFNRTALFGGKDDDTLTTNVVVPPGPGPADGVAVQFGEDGRDSLTATVTIQGVEPPLNDSGDRTATVLLDGGRDDDVITALANVSLFTFADVELRTEVLGGSGDDRIDVIGNARGSIGQNVVSNVVDGGTGDDRITVSAQTDISSFRGTVTNEVTGGDGHDFIDASAIAIGNVNLLASNVLDGGHGDDVLRAFNQVSSNVGGPLSVMQLSGDDGDDVLVAESHNRGNIIATEHSRLDGGKGDDVLNLDSSTLPALFADVHSVLLGGSGDDALTARLEVVVLGRPSVTLPVFNVSNVLDGGTGNDSLSASLSIEDDSFLADASQAVNSLSGGSGNDQLTAFASLSSFVDRPGALANQLDGGSGNDVLSATIAAGSDGASFLAGGSGNDHLTVFGGSGNVLDGGTGGDTLVSGTDNDFMNGGADADTFVFAPSNAVDTAICTPGEDTIDLTAFAASNIHDFADLTIELAGADSIIRFDADNSITVLDTISLSADDFLFA